MGYKKTVNFRDGGVVINKQKLRFILFWDLFIVRIIEIIHIFLNSLQGDLFISIIIIK